MGWQNSQRPLSTGTSITHIKLFDQKGRRSLLQYLALVSFLGKTGLLPVLVTNRGQFSYPNSKDHVLYKSALRVEDNRSGGGGPKMAFCVQWCMACEQYDEEATADGHKRRDDDQRNNESNRQQTYSITIYDNKITTATTETSHSVTATGSHHLRHTLGTSSRHFYDKHCYCLRVIQPISHPSTQGSEQHHPLVPRGVTNGN